VVTSIEPTRAGIVATCLAVIASMAAVAVPTSAGADQLLGPHVTMSVKHASPGDVVHFHGRLSKASREIGINAEFLEREVSHGCDLAVNVRDTKTHINRRTGRIHGHFTIGPMRGACEQSDAPERKAPTGRYSFVLFTASDVVGHIRLVRARHTGL
jgi:hypothetical protein